jgi:hypothetical protein
MMRIASRCPCLCASDGAASTIDHWVWLRAAASICDQNQRTDATLDAGKSTVAAASAPARSGPTRPLDALVRALAVEPLERLDAHAGVHEHVIDFGGPDDGRLRVQERGRPSATDAPREQQRRAGLNPAP